MFKFAPNEIELMEKLVDSVEKDNKENPCISGGGQEIKEVELNGYKWMIRCEIEVIPDQEDPEENRW